jgi:hypothetical protein
MAAAGNLAIAHALDDATGVRAGGAETPEVSSLRLGYQDCKHLIDLVLIARANHDLSRWA